MGLETALIGSALVGAYGSYSANRKAGKAADEQKRIAGEQESKLAAENAKLASKADAERARLNKQNLRAARGRIKGGLFETGDMTTTTSDTLG